MTSLCVHTDRSLEELEAEAAVATGALIISWNEAKTLYATGEVSIMPKVHGLGKGVSPTIYEYKRRHYIVC